MGSLGWIDLSVLIAYGATLVVMGGYFVRKSNTAEGFMVASRGLPSWAVGLAIMSAYTSSISYIATPGKAYDSNWHPLIFALVIPPITWLTCKFVVPYYRRMNLVSVYSFLEDRLGGWARFYGSLSFLLYMIGRSAVILYLAAMLMSTFIPLPLEYLILILGTVTIIYTLLGGMEAVVWTDVMQSAIMVGGGLFCAGFLGWHVFSGPEPLIAGAWEAGKFSLGDTSFSLESRTIWVMIIYGVTENLRNLIADQNYVQKYAAASSEKEAGRSLWISAAIYLPMTALFLFLGTTLYAFYSGDAHQLGDSITKGDQVFPFFIVTQVPAGIKGLIIAAILAAAMSTVDSALNCSATVSLIDIYKKYFRPDIDDRSQVIFLRLTTVFWGILGTGFALLMIRAKSALDTWWQISGIFGGGILGLFLLALFSTKIKTWQGIIAISVSIVIISWGTFIRGDAWWQCNVEEILIGAIGTVVMLIVAFGFALAGGKRVKISN